MSSFAFVLYYAAMLHRQVCLFLQQVEAEGGGRGQVLFRLTGATLRSPLRWDRDPRAARACEREGVRAPLLAPRGAPLSPRDARRSRGAARTPVTSRRLFPFLPVCLHCLRNKERETTRARARDGTERHTAELGRYRLNAALRRLIYGSK